MEAYDDQGNAAHYKSERIESIYLLERGFGTYEAMVFCEMNALKYRYRLGKKCSEPANLELKKIQWYENKAKEFRAKIGTADEIPANLDGLKSVEYKKESGVGWCQQFMENLKKWKHNIPMTVGMDHSMDAAAYSAHGMLYREILHYKDRYKESLKNNERIRQELREEKQKYEDYVQHVNTELIKTRSERSNLEKQIKDLQQELLECTALSEHRVNKQNELLQDTRRQYVTINDLDADNKHLSKINTDLASRLAEAEKLLERIGQPCMSKATAEKQVTEYFACDGSTLVERERSFYIVGDGGINGQYIKVYNLKLYDMKGDLKYVRYALIPAKYADKIQPLQNHWNYEGVTVDALEYSRDKCEDFIKSLLNGTACWSAKHFRNAVRKFLEENARVGVWPHCQAITTWPEHDLLLIGFSRNPDEEGRYDHNNGVCSFFVATDGKIDAILVGPGKHFKLPIDITHFTKETINQLKQYV